MKVKKFFDFKFLKDLKKEMNLIIWPSKEEVVKKTYLVVGLSFALTIFIFALDAAYSFILNEVIERFM